jgi:hypothetical protein
MSEVVGECKISRKRISECMIELQDLQQPVSFYGMKITVSKGSNVGCRLAVGTLFPKVVAKHVTFACQKR